VLFLSIMSVRARDLDRGEALWFQRRATQTDASGRAARSGVIPLSVWGRSVLPIIFSNWAILA
jgi:hypothetical protein